ncbi:MAG: dihydropteroate synthase [Tannerella sp.]|nr:dihydropteroate synthase [Tannerella sp.]
MKKDAKSLNVKGRLLTLDKPVVMGILNVTPDSFYDRSRVLTDEAIRLRIDEIIGEGGTIIDLGGYSSRPDAAEVTAAEEMARLKPALACLRNDYPDAIVSVDTFRPDIARQAVEEYGVAIVNDISGGSSEMFDAVADLRVPYILMHSRGTPQTMRHLTDYDDLMEEIMLFFAEKVQTLRLAGVNDVIIDPGFGFAKSLEQNYELMRALPEFDAFDCPLLVGISRKSMIYKLLDATPDESLIGTAALNTFAALNGADILRVHDVKAAVDIIKITEKLKNE